ncbi:MAG: hypothetical protein SGJ24_19390 [Chloroflexota bacterium]|nr:hypothetical protein [Chloroflexota bacterium]
MTVAELSVDEFKDIVKETVTQAVDGGMQKWFDEHEGSEDRRFLKGRPRRTWEQLKADIELDRWTPPPGSPSNLELLREDRDR